MHCKLLVCLGCRTKYIPHFCIRVEAVGESEHIGDAQSYQACGSHDAFCSLIATAAAERKGGPKPTHPGCCYALLPLRGRLHHSGACRIWRGGPIATCSEGHALVMSYERW